MPKTIVTVALRGNLIIATTMSGRELLRTTEDLKGNELVFFLRCVLGYDTKFKMVSPCARKISGGAKKIRAQLTFRRWHPKVHRVDPRQRLINVRAKQRADPVWKTAAPQSAYDEYTFVNELGFMMGGSLRGQMQKIPFDLGEAVEKAARDALARNGWTPQNQRRLAAAAQRVREWRP